MSQPFLIANMEVGLERDRDPWLLPDEAFPTLEDAYLFRGKIKRRLGYENLGRLVTEVGGNDTINLLPVMGLRTRELSVINQEQLIGFDTIKANRFSTSLDKFVDISFYKTTATAFSWSGTDSDFFWTTNYLLAFWATNGIRGFQSTPDASAGSGDGIRWYDGTGWINFLPQIDNAASPNFLMGAKIIVAYRNRLVMLNTIEGSDYNTFTAFRQRARWCQNGTPYYDANVPSGYDPAGFEADAWNADVVGKGGYFDAPTSEQIISAAFINDTLVVYFERSTWKLSYYGDPILPFVWERVNVELGAESTFSVIPFDAGLLGVGNYGIVISNGNEIKRIDQKIPDEVFKIHNGNDGVQRVYGIRDFPKQLVYWTFPDEKSDPTFPTRVLVYDYLLGTYAVFNDSVTCFGQYQAADDIAWEDLVQPWNETDDPWNSGELQSDYPLIVAGNQQGFVFKNYNSGSVINDPSLYINAITQALPVVVTSPDHNLAEGTIIALSTISGMSLAIVAEAVGTALSGTTSYTGFLVNPPVQPTSVSIYIGADTFTDDGVGNLQLVGVNAGTINYSSGEFTVTFSSLASDTAVTADYTKALNGGIFRVSDPSTNDFELQTLDQNGNFIDVDSTDLSAYVSDGLIQVRNNIHIKTKKFNPYINTGYQTRIQEVDYFLEFSSGMEFTTEVFLDENDNESVESVVVLPQTEVLSKVWYPAYYSAVGQFAQIEIKFSDEQMFNVAKSNGNITIHALLMFMQPAGRLTYGMIV